jgi:putative sterol carrier protein
MSDQLTPDDLKDRVENISTPAQLRDLLDLPGIDDRQIEEYVAAAGTREVLNRVFDIMSEHFVPERAGDDGGTVQWDVTNGGETHTYQLTITGAAAYSQSGAPDRPTVTLKVSVPTLLRLCSGRLDGISGFMGGKIKLDGDMIFGTKLVGWFDY